MWPDVDDCFVQLLAKDPPSDPASPETYGDFDHQVSSGKHFPWAAPYPDLSLTTLYCPPSPAPSLLLTLSCGPAFDPLSCLLAAPPTADSSSCVLSPVQEVLLPERGG